MDPNLRELSDLIVRWVHVIAGIMWVGNSMLFNWLDRNLERRQGLSSKSFGEIWLLHSGAYYQLEKKMLRPEEFPDVLHPFKWQSYTTWLSGISLLAIVYYSGNGGSYLTDPAVSQISADRALDFGLATIFGGFLFYDVVWRLFGKRAERLGTLLTAALLTSAVVVVPRVLSGRAAFIHVGAMLGTIMAGNVFLHIVPSQRELVRATKKGSADDLELSAHAKQRSIHNNYLTFPLLFLMVSNHFPSTYGGKHPSLVLAALMLGGALVRHFMNIRFAFRAWLPLAGLTIAASLGTVYFLIRAPKAAATTGPTAATGSGAKDRLAFYRAQLIIQERCVPCHSKTPRDPAVTVAPNGLMFDTPAQMKTHAERIKVRAVSLRTMPLANRTNMTDEERATLGAWLDSGADID